MCAAVTIVRIRARSSATVGKTTEVAEHALLEQPVGEADRRLAVAQDHGRDRRLAVADVEAEAAQLGLEAAGVRPQPLDELAAPPP